LVCEKKNKERAPKDVERGKNTRPEPRKKQELMESLLKVQPRKERNASVKSISRKSGAGARGRTLTLPEEKTKCPEAGGRNKKKKRKLGRSTPLGEAMKGASPKKGRKLISGQGKTEEIGGFQFQNQRGGPAGEKKKKLHLKEKRNLKKTRST